MKVATRFEGTLEEVKQQLQCWRKGKRKPMRLPEKLWTRAVKLSRTHGASQVARVLRLDYYKLKQRAANGWGIADFVEVQAPGAIEPITFGSGGRMLYPIELRAHSLLINNL